MKKKLAFVCLTTILELSAGVAWFAAGPARADTVISSSQLRWQWPYATNNIVFNIYAHTNLAVPCNAWSLIGTTAATSFAITENAPAQFFFVLASNTVSGAVSPWP